MPIDLTIEEIEGGFHFRDSCVDIKVRYTEKGYHLRLESFVPRAVSFIPLGATDPKSAYIEFRMAIDDYWSAPLNEAWCTIYKDKIDKLFAPLERYE